MPEEKMKRIVKSSVTEALMEALEMAENLEHVIILYEPKLNDDGEPLTNEGFLTDGEQDVAGSTWLALRFITWLTRHEDM